jgi:hypothetical protein
MFKEKAEPLASCPIILLLPGANEKHFDGDSRSGEV